jgi:hypothetical protein
MTNEFETYVKMEHETKRNSYFNCECFASKNAARLVLHIIYLSQPEKYAKNVPEHV